MDLNQLAVFIRVVEAGSFTRAAAALRQPKSRVSRRIAALERELGVNLLYRTTRQFSLTEAGRRLYHDCGRRVFELEAAAQGVREEAGEVAGVLRVTAAEDLGSVLLGPVLTELGAANPKLSVELLLSDQIVDLVRDGVDVAIRIGDLDDTSLRAKPLGKIAFILVASPRYLKSAPRLDTLTQLGRHPALVFGSPTTTADSAAQWTLRSRKGTETVQVRAKVRSSNPRILLELAIGGQGVALLPEFLCAEALKAGLVKRVLPGSATRPLPVQFVWPAQRETSPKLRAFVDLALRRLAKYFTPSDN